MGWVGLDGLVVGRGRIGGGSAVGLHLMREHTFSRRMHRRTGDANKEAYLQPGHVTLISQKKKKKSIQSRENSVGKAAVEISFAVVIVRTM